MTKSLKPWLIRAINRTRKGASQSAAFLVFSMLVFTHRVPGLQAVSSEAADVTDPAEFAQKAWNNFEKAQPELPAYAHRGYSSQYVENTPEAFAQATISGCPQLELDVWPSKDGILYVSHDDSLERIYKKKLEITKSSSSQLEPAFASNGQPIMTLQQILDLFSDGAVYLVELKDWEKCLPAFRQVLKDNPELVNNIQVQAWEKEPLEKLEDEYPYMYKQLLVPELSKLQPGLDSEAVNGIGINAEVVNSGVIASIHEAGKKAVCYTVNDGQMMDYLIAIGADGIISDNPQKVLHKYETKSD